MQKSPRFTERERTCQPRLPAVDGWSAILNLPMKWCALLLALLGAACGGSPTAPSQPAPVPQPPPPPPVAAFALVGQLSAQPCVAAPDGWTCEFFGAAKNTGTTCATNIRGTVKVYHPKPFEALMGSADFRYSGQVQPDETFTYRGVGLHVSPEGVGTYTADFLWDNVACQ